MSIKDRLAKKTGDLVSPLPIGTKQDLPPTEVESRAPRTGPGQMLAYRSHMQENNQRVQELQEKLREFEGTSPVRLLDASKVRASKWANRHDTSFENQAFRELKAEIESAGVNIQPIRVRPIQGDVDFFEIIFGHRRHQACLQLGICVSAIVEDMDDKSLFAAMDRENRARLDLTPYEQGEMYRRALDDGLFPSLRSLALALGVDAGNASKAIAIARLPTQVLAAFERPTQIQFRWGAELNAAMQKDPDGVISRAKEIRFSAKQLPPTEALERLLGRSKPAKSQSHEFKRKGKAVGSVVRKLDGSVSLSLKPGALDMAMFTEMKTLIEALLNSKSA